MGSNFRSDGNYGKIGKPACYDEFLQQVNPKSPTICGLPVFHISAKKNHPSPKV